MKSEELVAGVDISKDTLDIYFNDTAGKEQYLKTFNNQKGHHLLLQKLGTGRTYVMEASGPYYLRLCFHLKTAGADVRVENPIAVKRFIQMQLEHNKVIKRTLGGFIAMGWKEKELAGTCPRSKASNAPPSWLLLICSQDKSPKPPTSCMP
jgi:hypothetical protein